MIFEQLSSGQNLIELSRTQDGESGVSMTSIIILNVFPSSETAVSFSHRPIMI
jgi:hypothetical protein